MWTIMRNYVFKGKVMKKFAKLIASATVFAAVLSMCGCLKYTSNILEVTTPAQSQPQTVPTTVFNPYEQYTNYQPVVTTTVPEITTAEPNVTMVIPVEPQTQIIIPATTVPEATTAEPTTEAEKDPSAWSKSEIITYLSSAVNKTKAYTGNITAGHRESMEATVTECPGGSAVKSIVNKIVAGALDDSDETLNFSNGTAVSGEGETLQLLLPKSGSFILPETGVASASASKSGDLITIRVQLVPETGSLTAAPAVHASTMGYLDINSLDLSSVTVTAFDTKYPGSQMEITIDSNTGYVKTAVYTISLTISATGKVLAFTGTVGVSAKETESWTINW